MSERDHDEHQLRLFDDYQVRLRDDPTARAPRELDPGLADLARRLEATMGGPNPDRSASEAPHPAFVASLRQRIVGEAERLSQPPRSAYGPGINGRVHDLPAKRPVQRLPTGERARRGPIYWGALAAALAVLIVAGAVFWPRESNGVSAQEIVERASARIESPSLAGIDSFRLVEVTNANDSVDGPQRIEREHWYQAPDHWRIEVEEAVGPGDEPQVERYGTIATGEGVWLWSPESAERMDQSEGSGDIVEQMRFGPGTGLDAALASASDCYSPEITDDSATIAGRDAYVIDLGVSECPSASMPETNGRRVIWVDRETFFILKAVQYDGRPGQEETVRSETVVTEIEYNTALSADLFTPPATDVAGADQSTVETLLAPTSLDGFRDSASYPIFVPTYLPAGFDSVELEDAGGAAGAPQVRMTYSAASGDRTLTVHNGPTGCCLSYKAGASVTLPNGIPAHFVSDDPEGGAGILWWVQEGAYVSIDSTQAGIGQDELLEIATSMSGTEPLEPVPSADRPEATTRPTAVSPEGQMDVLYPGWLPQPSTITEEVRPDGRGGEFTMLLIDHEPDDAANDVLRLAEYPVETAPEPADDPQSTVEQIDGREVTVIRRGDACTAMSWQQEDVALSLTNVYDPPGEILYTCDQMRQIVASIKPGATPPTN